MKVLVTGGNGFIGSALIKYLEGISEIQVVGMVRSHNSIPTNVNTEFRVGELASPNKFFVDMYDIDVVVHTAGRAHVLGGQAIAESEKLRSVNTEAAIDLANFAAASGVKRFIFLSSIKVNGENTQPGVPITSKTYEDPQCAYGLSKYQAEQGLREIQLNTGLEVTIIRIPLVYGPGVKGNLSTLIRLLSLRIPLPLGSITNNRRSMIGIDNLLSVITSCLTHVEAKNRTFLVSDNHDISTYTLVNLMGEAIGKKPVLFRCPIKLLRLIGKVFNKAAQIEKLISTLQVDISDTCEHLDWKPTLSVTDGFKKMTKQ